MRVIDLNSLSMVGGSGIAETKVPLWWSDGTVVSTTTDSGYDLLQDGSSSTNIYSSVLQSNKLFTLSSSWPSNIQFAFECTIYTTNSSYGIAAYLWDLTSTPNTIAFSTISTSSTSATVIRSAKFNLSSNHNYGVGIATGGTYTAYGRISDASLIVFPQ